MQCETRDTMDLMGEISGHDLPARKRLRTSHAVSRLLLALRSLVCRTSVSPTNSLFLSVTYAGAGKSGKLYITSNTWPISS